jgi:DNA repair exonuclease SbcCD nuclease subunit
VLLGGDLFDSMEILPQILLEIMEILRTFYIMTNNQISIICIEGNHDIRRYLRNSALSWTQHLRDQ